MIKSSETVLSDENIYRIYDKLSEYARYSNEDRKKHLEYVQSNQAIKMHKSVENIIKIVEKL